MEFSKLPRHSPNTVVSVPHRAKHRESTVEGPTLKLMVSYDLRTFRGCGPKSWSPWKRHENVSAALLGEGVKRWPLFG
ncbi:hypothetical protein BaRGS_00039314 [Batillaria attramentaria]|uniref:Uncharacterized protein n=1 Tax=Batillaria attramentaria TaxID=370345 RepID=A0ABD0J3H9_9CAEN